LIWLIYTSMLPTLIKKNREATARRLPDLDIGGMQPIHAGNDLPNLDFLRAVAVLLVLFGHLTYFLGRTNLGLLKTYWMGDMGVSLFFVHTCLVLMLSLERQWKKQVTPELFTSFMVRRVFRIYPLSIAVVLLVVAFRLPMAELRPSHFVGMPQHFELVVSNLLLVQDSAHSILGPMWSLPYEMAMYLLLPWVFVFLYPNKSQFRISAIWLVSVLAGVAFLSRIGRPTTRHFLLYVPCFLPGIIAYQLQRTRRPKLPAFLWPAVVIVSVLLFLYNQDFVSNESFKSWFVCLLLGVAVPYFAQISARWLTEPSHFVAKYSYGIYLLHFFCIWLAFDYLHYVLPRFVRLALFTTLVIALPVLFYRFLEEPMIRVGKRLADGILAFTPSERQSAA
jgi:peptidoglycan/LPS O-acetylase OafA/YrhL